MRSEYFLHPVRLTQISMPGDRPGVLTHFLIVEFTNGSAPEVIVVINEPYLRFQSRCFDGGTQMLAHILDLDLLRKQASRHPAILIRVNFVLGRHSIDGDTLGCVCL